MKKMLINATQKEEVRIALVEDKQLIDLDVEQRKNDNKKSNIYNGVISRVEPSLEACFVNYGEIRDGFLPIKDIHPSYYENLPGTSAKDKLKPGQKLIVQVAREERGNKGAALTTYVAIASTFLVLMPKSPDVEGISRRLSSEERDNLRKKLNSIGIKPTEGVIVRTAGTGCTSEELQYDLNILHFIWDMIQKYSEENPEVGILHHESETIVRVIRDYLTKDVDEIITDSKDAYDKVEHYLKLVRPKSKPHLTLKDVDNIFSCPEYDIESQIAQAYEREVKLKSGGSIVIDTTEALTAIDVNSSRSTGNQDIESTAISTNLEAADEIARQLKIRDIGGLIVIDFIDMNSSANQRKVEDRMKKACGDDRARTQLARISKFGLMEVSRQRIRGSIAESINHKCPRCSGTGFIRDNESISLQILRQANEEATRVGKIVKLHILVPNDIAAYLLNEKRDKIALLEQQHNIQVVIVPQANLESPHYYIYRVRKGDSVKDSLSFHLPDYYKELEKTPRKSRAIDRNDEKLTQSSTSVPLEHIDKTFEARLEKADFIQQTVAQAESEKTVLHRIKTWFASLFAKKEKSPNVEEVVEEKVVSLRRKRRRSRKDRNRNATNTESTTTDTNVTAIESVVEAKSEKVPEKASNTSKRNRNDKPNAEVVAEVIESAPISVRKQIKSGDVVEEVLGGNSKRKRRKKEKNTFGDINPLEVKSQVEQQESKVTDQQEPTPESKPKLTRAERRRLQKVRDLDPEYDYEFTEENLGFDNDLPPKSGKRKDRNKAPSESDKVELTKEEIVDSKLELLEADELVTDIRVPRKPTRAERRRAAQERQAQANQAKEESLALSNLDENSEDSVNLEPKNNLEQAPNNAKAAENESTNAKDRSNEANLNDVNLADDNLNKSNVNLDNNSIISGSDHKKSRRRRKVNIEKKDLFLSRVPSCVDQQTFTTWLNPVACDDLVDEVDIKDYIPVPSLMDIVASDGSVNVKDRSPYRQVVRPNLPARKSNVFLGVINSNDFEQTKEQALDNNSLNNQNSLDETAVNIEVEASVETNLNDQVNSQQANDLEANAKFNNQAKLPKFSVDTESLNTDTNKAESVNNNTNNDSKNGKANYLDKALVKDDLAKDSETNAEDNLDANKPAEGLSRRERARRAKSTKLEKVGNNNPSSYRYQVFKSKQPCVNFNVDYERINRSKKRLSGLLNKKLKAKLVKEAEANVSVELDDPKGQSLVSVSTNLNTTVKTNVTNTVTPNVEAVNSSKANVVHKEVIIAEFDEYAKNVGFTEELATVSLEEISANLNSHNHLNSIIEELKSLTKKQTELVKLNDLREDKKSSTKVVNNRVESDKVNTANNSTINATTPKFTKNSDVNAKPVSSSSTKLSPFLQLPDDSALVVFANKTTNAEFSKHKTNTTNNINSQTYAKNFSQDDNINVNQVSGTNSTNSLGVTSEPNSSNSKITTTNVEVLQSASTLDNNLSNTNVLVSGGVLSKARSFSVGSTTTTIEHSDLEIPSQFDQYESNYTYSESGKSVSSPTKHTSTK